MEQPQENLVDSISWWLNKKRPFVINDQYSIELVALNKTNNTAKIKVTNLMTKVTQEVEVTDDNG